METSICDLGMSRRRPSRRCSPATSTPGHAHRREEYAHDPTGRSYSAAGSGTPSPSDATRSPAVGPAGRQAPQRATLLQPAQTVRPGHPLRPTHSETRDRLKPVADGHRGIPNVGEPSVRPAARHALAPRRLGTGECDDRVEQHIRAILHVVPRSVLFRAMATAADARNENHPGRCHRRQVLRVVSSP